MPKSIRPGDVLADRYRLVDLLVESGSGRFWRAHDRVLERHVALHVLDADDERAPRLLEAARQSATVPDRRLLRVLDADQVGGVCYVVNEWGSGSSLDIMLASDGPFAPRRAAWLVSEVAASVAAGHQTGVTHGRLVPENILLDRQGSVRVIGFSVDAALHGLPAGRVSADVADLGGLLYAALTGRWPGTADSAVPAAPQEHGRVLRPRQVRAGIPRPLDLLCDQVVNPYAGSALRDGFDLTTARGIGDYLREFVGDPAGLAEAEAAHHGSRTIVLPALRTGGAGGAGSGASLGTGPQPVVEPEEGEAAPDAEATQASEPAPSASEQAGDQPVVPDEAGARARATDVTEPGDDAATGEVSVGEPPAPEPTPPVGPPQPTEPTEPTETVGPADEDDRPPAKAAGAPVGSVEQATQAGLPIFDDDTDDVSWVAARQQPAPPPPPFEAVPERPLFAPEPAAGQPARRARPHVAAAAGGRDYWPWDTGTGTGTGVTPVAAEDEDDEVPGRNWMRLAFAIAAVLVLMLAVVVAFNLGRGRTPLGAEPDDSASSSAASPRDTGSSATPITDLAAQDFDPQGDPPEENPELAPLAVDGNPATSWQTMTYTQNLGPGGLKTGVGLTIDLGAVHDVSVVDLSFLGSPTSASLYVTSQAPTSVAALRPVGRVTDSSGTRQRVELDTPARGRFLTVWLTSLPLVDGGYRGQVAEVAVRG